MSFEYKTMCEDFLEIIERSPNYTLCLRLLSNGNNSKYLAIVVLYPR
jgi:hypothetical protein